MSHRVTANTVTFHDNNANGTRGEDRWLSKNKELSRDENGSFCAKVTLVRSTWQLLSPNDLFFHAASISGPCLYTPHSWSSLHDGKEAHSHLSCSCYKMQTDSCTSAPQGSCSKCKYAPFNPISEPFL